MIYFKTPDVRWVLDLPGDHLVSYINVCCSGKEEMRVMRWWNQKEAFFKMGEVRHLHASENEGEHITGYMVGERLIISVKKSS